MLINAQNVKEADTVKVPNHLTAPQLTSFKRTCQMNFGAATGGFNDRGQQYIKDAETLTFEQLSDPTPFPNLDAKFGMALKANIRGDMNRRIDLMIDEMGKRNPPQFLRGRQIYKIILDDLEPEAASLVADALTQLRVLQCPQINYLQSFLTSMDCIVDTCPGEISDYILEEALRPVMLRFKEEFQLDMHEYSRSTRTEKRNYQFLRKRA